MISSKMEKVQTAQKTNIRFPYGLSNLEKVVRKFGKFFLCINQKI